MSPYDHKRSRRDFFFDRMAARIHLLHRPKLTGVPGQHYGVAVEYSFGGCVVFDLVSGRGFGVQSFEDFLHGHGYAVEQTVCEPAQVVDAWNRLQRVLNDDWPGRFDPLSRNCEHVARFVVTGRLESRQVMRGFLCAAALVLVFVVLR